MDNDLITVGEAAALRGVSVGAVHAWIVHGRLRRAGYAPSTQPMGPRWVAVYRRADVLAVETPGRGRYLRRPRRTPLERPIPPPGPFASEREKIRAIRSCYPGLAPAVAVAELRASSGDVDQACDRIWLSRRLRP
jgi:hypothetical protein